MASDLAALRKGADSQKIVHSESATPATQTVPSTLVVDTCDGDPPVNLMLLPPVGGRLGTGRGVLPDLGVPDNMV